MLRINDVHCIHQFLVGEPSLQFKDQTYSNMWTMNLDSFKSSIIMNNLGEHPSKNALLMYLILNKKSQKEKIVAQLFHQAISN